MEATLLLFVSCCFIAQKITYFACSAIFFMRLQKISLTLLTPCSDILWYGDVSCHDSTNYIYGEDWTQKRPLKRQQVVPLGLSALTLHLSNTIKIFCCCSCCFHILQLFWSLPFWTSVFSKKGITGCCRTFHAILNYFVFCSYRLGLYHFICLLLKKYYILLKHCETVGFVFIQNYIHIFDLQTHEFYLY